MSVLTGCAIMRNVPGNSMATAATNDRLSEILGGVVSCELPQKAQPAPPTNNPQTKGQPMREDQLLTADDILSNARATVDQAVDALNDAYRLLGDAADWLRSDHRPLGSSLTDEQVATKDHLYEVLAFGKQLINEIKDKAGR